MVFLGRIKIGNGFYLGNNGFVPDFCFGEFVFVKFSCLFLLLAMIKDNRAVLGSHIGALAVKRGGVVGFPKYFQEFFVTDYFWVVGELDDLGVVGGA